MGHGLCTDCKCRSNTLAGVLGIRLGTCMNPAQYRSSIDCVANAGAMINSNGRVDGIPGGRCGRSGIGGCILVGLNPFPTPILQQCNCKIQEWGLPSFVFSLKRELMGGRPLSLLVRNRLRRSHKHET